MKTIRNTVTFLVMILLSAPLIYGQDLSKYRNFSLGTSLTEISKQLDLQTHNYKTTLIHQRPAVIQEGTFWLTGFSRLAKKVDPVSQIVFGFYNGELYRMVVIYDNHSTEGLAAEDMVQAVSAQYGVATMPATEISFPTKTLYDSKEKVIARWEDSQNSVNLFHSSTLDSFGLVVLSKRLDAEAEVAIIEAVRLDNKEAPQKEIERQAKVADDLEVVRHKNKTTFHPE